MSTTSGYFELNYRRIDINVRAMGDVNVRTMGDINVRAIGDINVNVRNSKNKIELERTQ